MATMGRKRKSTDTGLEPRVYTKHGAFYYVHRDGRWERLGADKMDANRKARLFNDPDGEFGTLVYWLDMFLVHCAAKVEAKTLSPRTLDDYTNAIKGTPERVASAKAPVTPAKPGALRVFFAPPMTPLDLDPDMVQDFLATNAELGRPVPANREKAALSSCMSWLIRTGKVPGLKINPCLRASGIKRNPEAKRDRYVTHDEYRDVWAVAHKSVRLMMELTYRTLQRPESDIITWTTEVLLTEDSQRKLHFRQGKTKKWMKVLLTSELDGLIRQGMGTVTKLKQPIVRTRLGEAYSYDGLSAMLKRSITKANKLRQAAGLVPMPSFGFRDLKGKGATDMWQAGIPIELIQQLCGHEDKHTTEIYVKQRWRETATANLVSMG
jgi:integrase